MTAAWLDRLRERLPRLGWLEAAVRHARVLQALPLGPGSRLLVVEFAGRHVLVGQSRAGLVRLAEGDAP
jgi:flagellar protein FliO/FliZ